MRKLKVRERAFKRIAFASTILGLVIMAIGLQQLFLPEGRFLVFLPLFILGGAVALVSVVIEPEREPGFTITLYTREGCSLCEEAQAWLAAKKDEYDFALWLVDVDQDAAANARYSDWVPVATLRDEELFRVSPDYPRLEARLRREADKRVRR
ncbi:MAG: hypothetical protein QOE90_635 [Thermoplasmata archaeon]|jgi:thioredoxin reductase (NADPH)|nr:hypothetical protein [Thermoplasmata archaeon]